MLWGGETERVLGDSERDVGALTAMESVVEGAVDEGVELWELVRRSEAARRGRLPAVAGVGAFRLMRAASWLREGMRGPADGRSDLAGASWGAVVVVGGGDADIVGVGGQAHRRWLRALSLATAADCITVRIPVVTVAFLFSTWPAMCVRLSLSTRR